jgi:hypothetical protein
MNTPAENIEKSDSVRPAQGQAEFDGTFLPHAAHKQQIIQTPAVLRPSIKRLPILMTMLFTILLPPKDIFAHGFNANHVDIVKTFGRKYRVVIKYTHVEVGEYREAHVDFDNKDEAIKVFQDLVKGADFFLGDVKKSIHFHTPPESNTPY